MKNNSNFSTPKPQSKNAFSTSLSTFFKRETKADRSVDYLIDKEF